MKPLSPRRMDAHVSRHRWYLLAGFALIFGQQLLNGVGVISGIMLVMLGASGGFAGAWRTERGLWMVAGLFGFLSLVAYVLFEYQGIKELIRGGNAGVLLTIDMAVGTALLWVQFRLLHAITVRNLRRPPEDRAN